jgi:hypothetical protein
VGVPLQQCHLTFPKLVQEFYGHMIITQDDDRGLIMQTVVKG